MDKMMAVASATPRRAHLSEFGMVLGARARGLSAWYRAYRMARDRRDAFAHLLYLDDAILDDIGVTRQELRAAADLPRRIDAAEVLRAQTRRPG